MVTFVYLAHSQERFRKQTVFSILSLLEYVKEADIDHRIAVYTDEPEFFQKLEVETNLVTAGVLKDWKGEFDFVHRPKICALIDASARYEGKVLYLDSDNCLFQDPVRFLKNWTDNVVIMESLEYELGRPADVVGNKYKRFFKKTDSFAGYKVDMTQQCWNAGVIGLPDPAQAKLPAVLSVCDELHQGFKKHLSEQMGFSIVMTKHFNVVSFREYTYHWFGHGQAINLIVDRVLDNYENDNLEELIRKVSSVKDEVRNAPLNRDKQPWYKRWFNT